MQLMCETRRTARQEPAARTVAGVRTLTKFINTPEGGKARPSFLTQLTRKSLDVTSSVLCPAQAARELLLHELAPPGVGLVLCVDGNSLAFHLAGPRWGPFGPCGSEAPSPTLLGGEYGELAADARMFMEVLRAAGAAKVLFFAL